MLCAKLKGVQSEEVSMPQFNSLSMDELLVNLEQTADSDYPAWALSIVGLAAVKMHDDMLDSAVLTALRQSCQEAERFKQAVQNISAKNKADAEIALAETINDIAEELRLTSHSSAP